MIFVLRHQVKVEAAWSRQKVALNQQENRRRREPARGRVHRFANHPGIARNTKKINYLGACLWYLVGPIG
jgi:hypothetical protein